MTLGPWKGIWPEGNHNVPPDMLQELRDGFIIDGSIRAVWFEQGPSLVADQTTIGLYEFQILSERFLFRFYLDHAAGDVLKIAYYNETGATSTITTALTPAQTTHVVAAPWQGNLYWSYKALGTIHRIDVSAVTDTSIVGSPANVEFLLLQNNNMLAIRQSGDSFVLNWSVDSNPEDWAGAGSGNLVLDSQRGRPQHLLPYKEDAIVLHAYGGTQVTATGVATPAFRTSERSDIGGALWTYGAASTGAKLYYISNDRQLRVYDSGERSAGSTSITEGTQQINVLKGYDGLQARAGIGDRARDSQPFFAYSQRLRALFISDNIAQFTLILDDDTNAWVANKDVGYDWLSDAPRDNNGGDVVAYLNDIANEDTFRTIFTLLPNVDDDNYDIPFIKTGRYYLGREVWIDRIDVIRLDEGDPVISKMILKRNVGDNQEDDIVVEDATSGTQEQGTYASYYVNGPAKIIQLTFESPEESFESGPFLLADIDAAGNVPVDPANPVDGLTASITDGVEGNNAVIDAGIPQLVIGLGLSAAGNLLLGGVSWSASSGIERIEIYGTELVDA